MLSLLQIFYGNDQVFETAFQRLCMLIMQQLFPDMDAVDGGVVPEGDEVPVEVDEQEEGLMDILYDSELAVCGLGPGVDVAEVAGQEQFFGAMDLLADDDDIDLM